MINLIVLLEQLERTATSVKLQCIRCDRWVDSVIMQADGTGLCKKCAKVAQPVAADDFATWLMSV